MSESFTRFLDLRSLTTSSSSHHTLLFPARVVSPIQPARVFPFTHPRGRGFGNHVVAAVPPVAPVSAELGLISTTERSDGSVVFQFGTAEEAKERKELEEAENRGFVFEASEVKVSTTDDAEETKRGFRGSGVQLQLEDLETECRGEETSEHKVYLSDEAPFLAETSRDGLKSLGEICEVSEEAAKSGTLHKDAHGILDGESGTLQSDVGVSRVSWNETKEGTSASEDILVVSGSRGQLTEGSLEVTDESLKSKSSIQNDYDKILEDEQSTVWSNEQSNVMICDVPPTMETLTQKAEAENGESSSDRHAVISTPSNSSKTSQKVLEEADELGTSSTAENKPIVNVNRDYEEQVTCTSLHPEVKNFEQEEKNSSTEVADLTSTQMVESPSSPSHAEDAETSPNPYGEALASQPNLVLSSGASVIPHPSKAVTGGEDAYFMSKGNWFGVADGVGAWSLEGINAGLYSREVMELCASFVSNSQEHQTLDPKEVLIRSVGEASSPGSSTALVARFDGQKLQVANIGDSGFVVVRNGTVSERSIPMVYEFNFPVQVQKGDDPSPLIESYKIELNEGDVIVAATDGLFDNLYEQEITSIISKSLEINMEPKEIASLLAMRAQEIGRSASARSPFADAAQAAGYPSFRGGKLDDVTVLISIVQSTNS